MKILAVETSSTPASCAVVGEDGRVLAASCTHTGLTHSQTLVPMIRDMLKNAALTLEDIGLLAVAAGPGSFTGIRIGVAAVKGLAFPAGLPCAGVSTLAAMARAAAFPHYRGDICAAMDARRGQVYTARFRCTDGTISRETPDEALEAAEAARRIAAAGRACLLLGDGAALVDAAGRAAGGDAPSDEQQTGSTWEALARPAPPHLRFQTAVGVALEALASVGHPDAAASIRLDAAELHLDAAELRPVYLRPSQAERELAKRTGPER